MSATSEPVQPAGAPSVARGRMGEASDTPLWPYYLVVFLMTAGIGVVFTLLAELRDEFGLSDLGVGLVASSGFLAALVAQLALARWADRGYSILMIRAGLGVAVLSMVLMTAGSSLWLFVLARATLGVATGLVIPAARRIVIAVDPENVGTNIGRLGSADIGGFAFGPALAAVTANVAGVRAPFVILGVLIVLCAPLAARASVDPGAIDEEHRAVRELLRVRPLMSVLVVATGFYLMIGTFDATWAILMTDNGASTWVIGFTITAFALPMIVLSPIGGRFAQRRGPIRAATLFLLLAVPCVVSYGFVTSVAVLATVAFIQSLFDVFTFPATQVGVAQASPPEQLAAAQGLLGAAELGAAGAMALVAGVIYDLWGAAPTYGATAALMVTFALSGFVLAGGRLQAPKQPLAPAI